MNDNEDKMKWFRCQSLFWKQIETYPDELPSDLVQDKGYRHKEYDHDNNDS